MSWLLAFCCVITLVAPSVVNAAADDFEIIDDTDARFVYSDGNANNGGWESAGAGDASVTEHWSNTAGATLDITFNGTKLELYGKKAANHAMFSVSIDGSEAVECDAYAAVTEPEAKLFESKTLAAGNHTAHITVLEKEMKLLQGQEAFMAYSLCMQKHLRQRLPSRNFRDIQKLTMLFLQQIMSPSRSSTSRQALGLREAATEICFITEQSITAQKALMCLMR